ncbi:hypothetical protein PG996_003165 [Apiospora saccharicola]|uniref:2EXR domain-containing protein n=1 Tax=Apiospora saccharicola TaxID=335842 RepID=A0ABR1W0J0_9PEZI
MPPACFSSLPPELRQMIWKEALEEEVDSRIIVVHRSTMRVLPHPSSWNRVMHVNQESRAYALRLFYDFKVELRPFEVDFSLIDEMALYGEAENIFRDRNIMKPYRAVGSDVLKQLRRPIRRSIEPTGTIYMHSQRDRFALASTKKDMEMPWRIMRIDMIERAFVPDGVISDLCTGMDADRSRDYNVNLSRIGSSNFFSTRMGGKLPGKAVKRIRRVVHLHAGNQREHTCGTNDKLCARNWKLGTFKGAQELSTARLDYIDCPTDLGVRKLLGWSKTEANGRVSFACTCQNGDAQDGAQGDTQENN